MPDGSFALGVPVQQPSAGLSVPRSAGAAEPKGVATSEPKSDSTTEQKTTVTMESDLAAITVSSRIAPFWRDMPKLWFTQLEAILAPQKLGQEAKFDLVVSKLGKEELSTVGDLLDNATGRSYETLKTRLISAFQESADRQFNRLVKEMEFGEQKPSQLYRRMAEAARNADVSDDTVKRLWLQRLPIATRAILTAVGEETKLEDLVSMADKIVESMGSGAVATVAAPAAQTTASLNAVTSDLIGEFRKMALELNQLRGEVSELRSRPRERDFRQNRSRSRSRSTVLRRKPDWLCRYHFKFRENARGCIQPCAWGRQQQSAGVAPPTAYAWQPPQGN
ncbi:uncharacterized protein LOC134805945 [Cydia splendana]|uniref:uncharacterized protein LOC134805945 n=1 Tax=Cydia splendana TaxID=1100963 RepID=UPI00300C53DD